MRAVGLSGSALLIGTLTMSTASADTAQLTDLDKTIASQLPYCDVGTIGDPNPIIKIDSTDVTNANAVAHEVGEPSVSLGDGWYIGTSILTNDTDQALKLSTQSFTKKVPEAVSTSVKNGVTFKGKVLGLLAQLANVPAKFTNTTVNFAEKQVQEVSAMGTYTSPAQQIDVPPHTVAHVTVNLQKVEATGQLALEATLGGTFDVVQYARDYSYGIGENNISLYDCLSTAQKKGKAPALPSTLALDNANKKVRFNGTGTYTATYGTNYLVNVTFAPQVSGAAVPKPFTRTITAR
ncbi:ETX/MTX2 family pore-forming toxin [Streptomyces sp. I6]|uniref:ETX/MTX2 family pore-forming toxin n=2 Tax=unclassified Streptomyces TaxID=2593676 RepID=UPI00160C234D|nr:ETX/MTX2 family pore-forming toxin [Streptomyces sp. I6]